MRQKLEIPWEHSLIAGATRIVDLQSLMSFPQTWRCQVSSILPFNPQHKGVNASLEIDGFRVVVYNRTSYFFIEFSLGVYL